ncbi:poliovirus receptor [Canis lupus familiaris]|uniref:PVR cell adhesion molecule n=2 Tax=Canis lupus familiaris TaxID=9615 RepID=A0A8P0N7E0_CANLF|nr:poliovirus receptor [Canis lupus familiaris]XP_025280499.3 poliovirus receptor [Canis lupus dingo]XP_038512643.1 poliovirus receptor [Canis lupus familiaris]|eukprot:XP_005616524.1 poliovirus receptor [Canis lupus familiaris]
MWPPPLWLLPLLPLLLWAPTEAGPVTVGVLAPAQVHGLLGDTAELSCQLPPLEHGVHVTQVTWTRRDAAGEDFNVAVFHPTQGPSFPEPGRLEFVAARPGEELRDGSLALRGLRADDEANYTCRFAMFPEGSRSAHTWLRVLAQPENKAESEEVLFSPLSPEPVPVARCVSSEGRPPARISWPHLDGQANESQVPGHLPGTFTVISLLTLIPSSKVDGKNVTCRVEHESLKKPVLLPVTLAVPYPPEVSISGYDGTLYMGHSEVTLSCDVRSKPEPTGYNWSTTVGPLPPSAVAQGSQLLIHTVDESINTTFICRVSNALGTGQAELSILVREKPPNKHGLSTVTIIICGAVAGIIVVLGLLLYFLLYRRPRQNQRSSTANGHVIYTAVNPDASSSQDPQTNSPR